LAAVSRYGRHLPCSVAVCKTCLFKMDTGYHTQTGLKYQ
jgi:hypothetical protein